MKDSFETSFRSRKGYTLIEIMLVVAILSLLASLAIPNYIRVRKRSQAVRILDELKSVDHAMDQYAAEFQKKGSEVLDPTAVTALKKYLKTGTTLYNSLPNDMFGNAMELTDLQTPPRLHVTTFNALSDVAPSDFWEPYGPVP